MTYLDMPNQPGAMREPITVDGHTFVFEANFPIGSPFAEDPTDVVVTNHMRVFQALAERGLGVIAEAPAMSNDGSPLEGMAPFYRSADVSSDTLRDIEEQLTILRPDAFSGITGNDEQQPENAQLLGAAEVDALVLRAISATERSN